ncbi:MAG: enoyl-CoA hydratase/isomerase family protein [Desulfomonile sp.]|nr:enoyl-CoA hydratase/isomerase family protein [Desulfomonile sp.]
MAEVTYALDRDSLIGTMVIDTAGPVNTIGQRFITDLEKATAQALRDSVRGVMIVSTKKTSFLDGANLQEIMQDATPQMIRIVMKRYQDALATLAKAPFPVVAVLDGQTALGGGFELLLWACDHVFASPGSKVGLPEVNVGLFPAGGGTQTLPKVVGFKTAVEMITQARISRAEALAGTGVVTMCPSGELRERAIAWLREHEGIVNRNYDPNFRSPDTDSDEEKQKALNKARFRYTISPYRPYMLAAIESLEGGLQLPFDKAVARDVDLFVPLLESPFVRNKINLFSLVTSMGPKLAKVDIKAALKVDTIAIIGAGLMGRGIAQVAAERGVKVTLIDVDENTAKGARDTIDRTLEDLVFRGRWPRERKDKVMSNITCTGDYAVLKETPLVIECVFEDLPLKKKILAQVQDVNPDAIFASNTSTLPMADISAGTKRPEQVVGMHFFSPVPLMPLLEVIEGPQSSSAAVATAVTIGRTIGKTVIMVGDGPGFYTSRTFGSYVIAGFRLAELGVSPWDVDFIALQAGFPQGPLHIYGTAGGSVVYHASSFMATRLPDRVQIPETLERLYKAGYVGAGKPCFYLDDKNMVRDESVLQHIALKQGLPTPTREEIEDILHLSMVNEAFWCLSDGVLRDYPSMDLGSVLGIGFPDCWHGPARYVSLKGVKRVKARLEELRDKFQLPGLVPAPEFDTIIACGVDSSLI